MTARIRLLLPLFCFLLAGPLRTELSGQQPAKEPSPQPKTQGDANQARHPNVLFIAIDDLRPELACYGASHIDSPHLDRFARQAVRFKNHYVQVATCGASRYSMLTGRSPIRSGVTRQNNAFFQGSSQLDPSRLAGAQTMPELFRRNGYHTCQIGKISHTADGRVYAYDGEGDGRREMPHAWDELATPLGSWKRGWGVFFAYANGVSREDGSGHADLMEFVVEDDEELPDGLNAKVAVEKLQQYGDQDAPFFLAVGFYKPHLPFVAPKQDWLAMQDIAIPEVADADKPSANEWHRSGEFYRYDFPFPKTRPLSEDAATQARRAYAACVRYTDRQVGRVLEALAASGQADNTIVVIWGDHGWQLGEQQIWGKHTPWERALRSVLMILAPGVSEPGTVNEEAVESLDLYPTLVDLCGLRSRKTAFPLDGRSLRSSLSALPLSESDPAVSKPVAFSFWNKLITASDGEYRLVCERTDEGAETSLRVIALYPTGGPLEDVRSQHPDVAQRLQEAMETEFRDLRS